MSYNLTSVVDNATTIIGFTKAVDSVLMQNWLGTIFLIAITIIVFMSFYFSTQDSPKSISASCFIAFGMAIFLRALGMITGPTLYITLILASASIAFTWKRGNQ